MVEELSERSLLYEIDPEIKFSVFISLTGSTETLLHRLRLNVAYTACFLHRIHCADFSECACSESVEDETHLVLE